MESVVYGRATPQDVQALGELADRVFRPQLSPGAGMPREFPLLFHEDNAANLFYAAVEGRFVTLVGTLPNNLHLNGASVKAVSVGAVCTDPEYRGRGYASALMQQVEETYRDQCGLMLISGDRSLYLRMGAVKFGELLHVQVVPASRSPNPSVWVRAESGDSVPVDALHALYLGHALRFFRPPAHMRALLKGLAAPLYRMYPEPVTLWTAGVTGDTRPWAYLVAAMRPTPEGQRAVHVIEWAGVRRLVVEAMAVVAEKTGADATHCLGQPSDQALRLAVADAGGQVESMPNIGTICLINPERVVHELAPWLQEHRGYAVALNAEDQGWRLTLTDIQSGAAPRTLTFSNRAELGQYLFSPSGLNISLPNVADLNFV